MPRIPNVKEKQRSVELELSVLAVLEHQTLNGYQVHKQVNARTPGLSSQTPIYSLMHLLTQDGVLTREDTGPHKNDRALYTLTEPGHARLAQLRTQWQAHLDQRRWMLQPSLGGALTSVTNG